MKLSKFVENIFEKTIDNSTNAGYNVIEAREQNTVGVDTDEIASEVQTRNLTGGMVQCANLFRKSYAKGMSPMYEVVLV